MASVFDRIVGLLDARSIPYEVMRHDAVTTSEAAAQVRGTTLASGAKALVCKADGDYVMFVMPANLRLDSKQTRRNQRIRSLRFASPREVTDLTGLQPGAIPPFGSLFSMTTFCDQRLSEQPTINFNAGDHCVSISMRFEDFVVVEQPRLGDFAG